MRGGGSAVKSCVSQLETVQQKCVYAVPTNIFGWDRTGARTSLQSLQAAKIFIRIFSEILILELSRRNFTASLLLRAGGRNLKRNLSRFQRGEISKIKFKAKDKI